MKKLFLSLLFVALMAGLIYAQADQGHWDYDDYPVCGYSTATDLKEAGVTVPGFRNCYSATVDPDGKVWAGSYYARRDEVTLQNPDTLRINDSTVVNLQPIFIVDPVAKTYEAISFLNLPDGGTDTLASGHRGMRTDPDGNIIASFANGAVYKINYQTHDVIAKYETGGSNGRPGVDADGYVYQMDGVFASRIDILDPDDWTSPFNTISGISAGVTRCSEVSPDGQNVYLASQNGGVYHFYSADGVFGTYTLVDTIMATVMIDDTTEAPFVVNLVQWHPDGLLWVASYDDVTYRKIFSLDPDQNYAVIDTLPNFQFWGNTDGSDTTWAGYAQPQYLRCVRDAYFNAAGDEFYAAEFYGYGVKKFAFTPPSSIQPGQDMKEVPGTFTLYRNYPNPFNPTTTIPFELHKRAHVVLRIYDARGSLVGTYYNRDLNPGMQEFHFNANGLASGQYYFKLTVDHSVATGKMMLVK